MRQQTKPFIIEKKTSRKLKSDVKKPSIWGRLDLSQNEDRQTERGSMKETAVNVDDRP